MKLKREHYKNLFLFAQPVCFDMHFYYKILINVHNHGNYIVLILFYFVIYISVSVSKFQQYLNDKEMLFSHLMLWVSNIIKNVFHDENKKKKGLRKRKTLTKLVLRKNHSFIANFRIPKSLKE